MKWTKNQFKTIQKPDAFQHFKPGLVDHIHRFHKTIPEYSPTPLYQLKALSAKLGIGKIYVKDESKRFGLNAFKALGATYTIAKHFAKQLSIDLSSTNFLNLIERVKSLPTTTFATTTDGNHGKGVAWAASLFHQPARIFMPKGSASARLEAIRNLGAQAEMTDLNYDDTVKMVAKLAKENGWVLVQDTAWEGYEEIPIHIMQGYLTIIGEIKEQLSKESFNQISHVILQAGVGSFPAAIAAAIYQISNDPPSFIIVEPEQANCFYQSAFHSSGLPQRVYGNLTTMMAGLACGKPNPFAWAILKSTSDFFFSCADKVSEKGMRVLGNPLKEDPRIIAGESGAVPLGLLYELLSYNRWESIRSQLKLDLSSNILVINTEGDTDPVNYRNIVWGHEE
ncbi:diaminopropionate ammonia-lyase [Seinonella peptonophila]|uniref:Diaminopropionate ammonia-lyase n=1 Tax=Seinonella peptonophila TaxID=112248 RepID=A0A1M5A5E1_9BACL|nr:diaminopropionate ammonia-lyase [Seinonella peptonophila]SHF25508.1 diaminopropionate ammonia-lyase [Seinonella peptonophila]